MAVSKRKTKKATTTVKKKKKTTRRRRRDSHINYRCILRRCTARPKHARIGRLGDMVELEAKNTDVDIDFSDGSPFEVEHIHIDEGDMKTFEIVNRGEYEYDLVCKKCRHRLAAPPSMIVD